MKFSRQKNELGYAWWDLGDSLGGPGIRHTNRGQTLRNSFSYRRAPVYDISFKAAYGVLRTWYKFDRKLIYRLLTQQLAVTHQKKKERKKKENVPAGARGCIVC